jgi:flagellar biosynthesis protein FlhG
VLYAVSLADEVMVVATPEPTSLTDAYATIKVLASQQQRTAIKLLVNQVSRAGEGRGIRGQLQQVVDRFVTNGTDTPLKLELMGDVPIDTSVREAVQRRQLLLEAFPGSAAAQGITAIAEKMGA